MDGTREHDVPTTLELVQRTLGELSRKSRIEGLKPVEELGYRNLCELQEQLLDGLAS